MSYSYEDMDYYNNDDDYQRLVAEEEDDDYYFNDHYHQGHDAVEYDSDGNEIYYEAPKKKLYSQDEILCSVAHNATLNRHQGQSLENLPKKVQTTILRSLDRKPWSGTSITISKDEVKKTRSVFKKVDFSSASKLVVQPAFLGPSSSEIEKKRVLRESLRFPVMEAWAEHKRKCRDSIRPTKKGAMSVRFS